MFCFNYISRLLNTYGWGISSQEEVPNKNAAAPAAKLNTTDGSVLEKVNQIDNSSMVPSTLNPEINNHNTKSSINPYIDKMKSSLPLRPLPTDCIEQIFSKEGVPDGTVAQLVLNINTNNVLFPLSIPPLDLYLVRIEYEKKRVAR